MRDSWLVRRDERMRVMVQGRDDHGGSLGDFDWERACRLRGKRGDRLK